MAFPPECWFAGPAGIGKTRLLRQATESLADGDVLMVGHCVDLYGEEIPYCAPADALRDLGTSGGGAEGKTPGRAALCRVVSVGAGARRRWR